MSGEKRREPELKSCRSCGAAVWWVTSSKGTPHPLNYQVWCLLVGEGEKQGVDRYGVAHRGREVARGTEGAVEVATSHFATCPNAKRHRRQR